MKGEQIITSACEPFKSEAFLDSMSCVLKSSLLHEESQKRSDYLGWKSGHRWIYMELSCKERDFTIAFYTHKLQIQSTGPLCVLLS